MVFKNPYLFFLLLLLIPYIVWYILKVRKSLPSIQMPGICKYRYVGRTWRSYLQHIPFILHVLFIIMLIVCIARPQIIKKSEQKDVEGIDIMLCVDISSSMLAQDFKPDRMKALRSIARDFINHRENDNIGLTIFAGEAITQCPLTLEHDRLISLYNDVDILSMLSNTNSPESFLNDGTAIGDGLMNSLLRLHESNSKSKIIILLSDGFNNAGHMLPIDVAKIAKNDFNVKIYTIGIGRNGEVPFPNAMGILTNVEVKFDEELLQSIAQETGGKYFHANNSEELSTIYQEIDKMERSKFQTTVHKTIEEKYQLFALIAFFCLLLELLIKYVLLRRLP